MTTTITNVTELQAMQDDLSEDYVLGNDIDASATSTWNAGAGFDPIAQGADFTGTLNGAGYTISDLFVNRPTEDTVGLLGYVKGGTIQNISLTNVSITGNDYVGGLAGFPYDGAVLSDCSVTGAVTGTGNYVGGLCGYSTANVGQTPPAYTDCSSTATVSATASSAGGLVGEIGNSTFSRCYATGDVTGADNVGGFVGRARGSNCTSTFANCYARGDVTATGDGGGFMAIEEVWGTGTITFTNCYSTGLITAGNVGGFIYVDSGRSTYADCFWDTQTSGTETSDGGTGKTTAEMKTLATFYGAGWNIGETATSRNDGYPFLSWEINQSATIWLITTTGTRSFTIPDVFDHKGRYPKGAKAKAYRVDTHAYVTEATLDEHGSATLVGLPNDVDVVVQVTWGGPRTRRHGTRQRGTRVVTQRRTRPARTHR